MVPNSSPLFLGGLDLRTDHAIGAGVEDEADLRVVVLRNAHERHTVAERERLQDIHCSAAVDEAVLKIECERIVRQLYKAFDRN